MHTDRRQPCDLPVTEPKPPTSSRFPESQADPSTALSQPPLDSRSRRARILTTLGIGLGAGLLNALVGIGGGILIVPGLVIVRKLHPRVAVATSLGSVLLLSAIALGAHVATSPFELSLGGALLLLIAGPLGSQAGGFLLNRIQTRWILFAFAAITMLSASYLLAIGLDLLPKAAAGAGGPALWAYGVLGLVGGFFSGLLGVGGGGLVMLGFSVLYHTPVLAGLPVAQAVNTLNSLSGVIAQWRSKQVLWREVFALVPSGLVGVAAGQAMAVWLPPDALRVLVAAFFLYMGASLIRRGLRMKAEKE